MLEFNENELLSRYPPERIPRACDLVVTERCMLRCQMCQMWRLPVREPEVPMVYYQACIEALYDAWGPDMSIQFVGGEPLMKPGLLNTITWASHHGFRTLLTSNGVLIDRAMARTLAGTKLTSLTLSLDSADDALHDELRGERGVAKRLKQALRWYHDCRQAGQSISIVATIMAPNLDHLVQLVDWAEAEPAIDAISFQAIVQPFGTPPHEAWYTSSTWASLWPQDADQVNRVLDSLIQRRHRGGKIATPVEQLQSFKRYFAHPAEQINRGTCHLGWRALSVSAAGDMYLCFDQEPIGSIMRDRIDDVWESARAHEVRQRIASCRRNCKLVMNCFSAAATDEREGDA